MTNSRDPTAVVDRRYDFVFLFDVCDGNPNGEVDTMLLARLRAQSLLDAIDETGAWTVLSALLAFGTFLLETLNEARCGVCCAPRSGAVLRAQRALICVKTHIILRSFPLCIPRRTISGGGTCCSATICRSSTG